jgi:hypothetical protein
MNRALPSKVSLTDAKDDKLSFASMILSAGQAGVMDRGFQC